MKVVIVGGGVIGMLQARALAKEGHDVTIVDKGELGREASWAGGGIVSPLYPWRYSQAVTNLARRSQAIYHELVEDISFESGLDPELSSHGLLMLKVQDEETATQWAADNESWMEEIDAQKLYQLEPNLAEGFTCSLWMPKVASIRNPRLLNALRKIVRNHAAISVKERCEVIAIADHQVELKTGETLTADIIVVCSGAWTSKLLPQLNLQIQPVKGQMILFDAPQGLANRVVLSDGRYVIPRQDGKVLAGSTLEYKDFDKTTDDEALASLKSSAYALYPDLQNCLVSHHWAGLRPGSPNGVPVIGALPEYPSIFVNAGHFRNGLVLAPASVELLTQTILGEEQTIDSDFYRVENLANK